MRVYQASPYPSTGGRTLGHTKIDLIPADQRVLSIQDEFRDYFGWSLEDDVRSAYSLLEKIEQKDIKSWSRPRRAQTLASLRRRLVLRESRVAILGAAISVSEVMKILERNTLLIAADGACGVLNNLPESQSERAWSRLVCVVSDADGGDGLRAAVKRSIPIILHAHGDNVESWDSLVQHAQDQRTPPELILTHQTPHSIEGMHNPGGFTDGDRAVCFVRSLGIERDNIILIGTRTDVVGEWSGITDIETKLEKLKWMSKVLQHLGFLV
tara:strand:- start:5887 stop:6693 length:807 start_codon:yes stop_codon:yes gene_type:complete